MGSADGLFPTPHHAEVGALGPRATSVCLEAPERLTDLARTLFGDVAAPSCACVWTITVTAAPTGRAEQFALSTRFTGGRAATSITAPDERTAWHGLLAAHQLLVDGRVPEADVVDYPELAPRGILEGYYGTPYSPEQRATTIRLASRLRQTVYVYGPKTDDFARTRWAEPYPEEQAASIAAAAATARAELVRFVWSISPGLPFGNVLPMSSIRYGSDEDFARLVAKIESVRAFGVTDFALFLDDIAGFLPWPEDAARFASLAEAHAFLINRLDDHLRSVDANARLLVVGSEYTSLWPTWRPYNEQLGPLLHADVEVLWTGPGIYTLTMDASDMDAVDAALGRRVSIWDNAPSSVAPLEGRSADLPRTVGGFYSNPVLNEFDRHPPSAFWEVQGTLADYAWNPAAYDPAASFDRWRRLRVATPFDLTN
jgi:hyaluronoglucosaminidase